MKSQVFINHLECSIPEDRFYLKDHLDHFNDGKEGPLFPTAEKFMEFVNKYLDVESVAAAKDPAITQDSMTMDLLKKGVESGKIDTKRIAMIIVAPDASEQIVDFGPRVQFELNMPKAKVLRITDSYCANIDLAIGLAKMFLENLPVPSDVLLIAGNKQEYSFEGRVVGSYGLMGDGVSYAVLTNEPGKGIAEVLGQESVTKGVMHKADLSKDNTIVHFQGYTESVKALFAATKVAGADVTGVVLHNANLLLATESIKTCGVKADKVDKTNLKKYGHLGTTDLLLNLKTHIENKTGPGMVLSSNLGINGTYVSTLFKI
jgi:3-oxoacyl-[acyl-carrier-protein] synthase III